MSGFSFGFVSRLLKNRFQFCLRAASVSGFQFRFKTSFIQESYFTVNTDYLISLLFDVFVLLR